jgi:hypothetical protein
MSLSGFKSLICRISYLARLFKHRFSPCDYKSNERLYRGITKTDLEPDGRIRRKSIRFPDFSCNWSRFSRPIDVRKRKNSSPNEGCYSFTVETARYKKMAAPCHDPEPSMYCHTEVRQLTEKEDIHTEPPKGRKLKSFAWSPTRKNEYREYLAMHTDIEIYPGQ